MSVRPFWIIPILALCGGPLHAQLGCAYPGLCTDPVPAVDITTTPSYNVWQDSYSNHWTLTSDQYGDVSGFVDVPFPTGCPTVRFTVNGSITPSIQVDGVEGYTTFSWTGTNPQPSNECGGITPVSSTYTGTIENKGNDYSNPSYWTNVNGQNGTTGITKQPHDQPASETTTAEGFGGSGVYVSVGQFRQILNASPSSTDIFKGRQVSESTGTSSPHYDNCWYSGSAFPKWTTVDGSLWNVGYYPVDPPCVLSENTWADDYIGYPYNYVQGYRMHWATGSPLYGARIPQVMSIAYHGNQGSAWAAYAYDTVGEDIYRTSVTAYRAGVSQTNNQ